MTSRGSRRTVLFWVWIGLVLVLAGSAPLNAQTFNSGSDGSDGPFLASGPPGTVRIFDPAQYHGSQVSANIFNFTTITIAAGVTVKLSGNKINGPVIWLSQGNVDIQGAIDLSGSDGHPLTSNPFLRAPAVPGAGGYVGGVGGNTNQAALPGSGTGGGAAGANNVNGGGGTFGGNTFLIPLVGGSGGGGGFTPGSSVFDSGGGAGGGALLIASTTQISVGSTGVIDASGGSAGVNPNSTYAGCGAGGAIRLVSTTIAGTGALDASPGTGSCLFGAGGPGVIRLEALTVTYSGSLSGIVRQSTPFPLLLPTSGMPTATVLSINGTPINANSAVFPDLMINTTAPVDVVIQTRNVPTSATVRLTILGQNGVADTVLSAPPLGNCDTSNVCTTTMQVVFPFGASRGLTKVTWVQ